MLKRSKRLVLLTMVGLLMLPSLITIALPAQSVGAATASVPHPVDQLERWMMYRGMRACLEKPWFGPGPPTDGTDNETISVSNINNGKLDIHNHLTNGEQAEGFGYLGKDMDNDDSNDGTVDCSDGSIWVRSANLFGFGEVKNLICAMNTAAGELGDGGRIKPRPDISPCVDNATEFEFDGGDGVWQQMLTKALEDPIASDYGGDGKRPAFDFNSNNGDGYTYKSLLYLLGKNSLETFCGGSLASALPNDQYEDSEQGVSVYIVNESNGIIKESGVGGAGYSHTYVVTKKDKESDNVNDVYFMNGGNSNEADDRNCGDMARWTREGARDYANFLRTTDIEPADSDPGGTDGDNPGGDSSTSCAVDGIGWIVCPVVTFLGEITDTMYDILANNLLQVNAGEIFDTSSPTFTAWSAVRNLANIAFVMAFLIIIYAQITGTGLSNYGVKKMLPKLIVSAVLVNTSFWICAIAVDVSNIVGFSAKELLDTSAGAGFEFTITQDSVTKTGNGWSGLAVAILATGGLVYVGLSVLLPALIIVAFAVVTVVAVLAIRQALIILLIVVAPLAFVAYLLPNTEEWFKKWLNLFKTMLLIFPIISVVFGASSLASVVVMGSAQGNVVVSVVGALIGLVPLFITPIIMKSAGGVLNRIGGVINNPNKGPFDRMKKGADNVRERQQNRRAIRSMNGGRVAGGGQFRRKAKREAIDASLKRERAGLEGRYIANEAVNADNTPTGFGKKLAGAGPMGGGADVAAIERALASASITIDKAEAEEVNAASVIVRDKGKEELKGIVGSTTSSEAQRAAAMQRLVKISEPPEYINQVNSALHGDSNLVRRATAEALGKDGPASLKASDIDRFATNTHADEQPDGSMKINNLEDVIKANVANGVLSQEKMVNETPGNLKFAFDVSGAPGRQVLQDTAIALKKNSNLNGQIKHNAEAISALEYKVSP